MPTGLKRTIIGLVLLVGLALLIPPSLQAQPQRMTVEERVKMLKDQLKLTDEQSTKITTILEDMREEMTTAMKDIRDNPDSARAVRREMMKKTDESIKSVLTEDQAKKYDTMMKERRPRKGRRTQ